MSRFMSAILIGFGLIAVLLLEYKFLQTHGHLGNKAKASLSAKQAVLNRPRADKALMAYSSFLANAGESAQALNFATLAQKQNMRNVKAAAALMNDAAAKADYDTFMLQTDLIYRLNHRVTDLDAYRIFGTLSNAVEIQPYLTARIVEKPTYFRPMLLAMAQETNDIPYLKQVLTELEERDLLTPSLRREFALVAYRRLRDAGRMSAAYDVWAHLNRFPAGPGQTTFATARPTHSVQVPFEWAFSEGHTQTLTADPEGAFYMSLDGKNEKDVMSRLFKPVPGKTVKLSLLKESTGSVDAAEFKLRVACPNGRPTMTQPFDERSELLLPFATFASLQQDNSDCEFVRLTLTAQSAVKKRRVYASLLGLNIEVVD